MLFSAAVQAVSASAAELLAEDEEQSTELGALRLGEAGEDLVFGVALRLGGAFELLLPLLGDGDDVPAAVVCGAFACEVAVGFERVEQCDEDARVDVHERSELALAQRSSIVQQSERPEDNDS